MKEEILRENKKWRIILIRSDEGCSQRVEIASANSTYYRLSVGKTTARLQKKKWFFGSFWHTREFTNMTSVVHEWIDDCFRDEEIKRIWRCDK